VAVIDWVKFRLPMMAARECALDGGMLAMLDCDGTVEWSRPRDMQMEGSYSSKLMVRTVGDYLQIDGNPVKWWQGHNLFGTDDLRGLVVATASAVCRKLDLPVRSVELAGWQMGWIPLLRVDCTRMYEFPSRSDVLATLRAAALNARSRHGTATCRGDTVYWGQHSRSWALKAYSKGQELGSRSRKHQLPEGLPHRERLEEYADSMLRVELVLRKREIERRGLYLAAAWEGDTAMEQLRLAMEGLQVSDRFELPSTLLAKLPGRLVSVYRAWQAGDDLRALYSNGTFYNYRRALLEHGIDITVVQPAQAAPANVVPFTRLVEVRAAEVPEWAKGTSLYFEPAEYLGVAS